MRDDVETLLGLLREEAAAMEQLVYRSSVSALLTQAWQPRFFGFATDELEDARLEVSQVGMLRDEVVARLAEAWSVPVDSLTLAEVAERAPEDLRGALVAARDRLRRHVDDLERLQRLASTRHELEQQHGGA